MHYITFLAPPGYRSPFDPKPTVSLVHIVTQWSGSGGTEAYLSGQLASFRALTLLVGSPGL